tara:strand:- start:1284 stop:1595 length:312 start_codon:yes stop_codon:yes gene_type:complete
MNIDYTIGDDIVSIKTHADSEHKEGELFKCLRLLPSNCNCAVYMVDIGKKCTLNAEEIGKCPKCQTIIKSDGIAWFNATSFKKLDTLVNISELTEILEQPAFN